MKKIFIVLFALVTISLSFACGFYVGERSAHNAAGKTVDTGAVVLPGYDHIRAKSSDQEIILNLYNPKENACPFSVSLILPDGTEVFRSGMIYPGDTLNRIELNAPVPIGTYEKSVIRYYCFTADGARQLNGADINFTLEVTP